MNINKFQGRVLRKGMPATLSDWIDRRIGGEVEITYGHAGETFLGKRGQLAVPMKRGAEQYGGPPWKRR